MATKRNTPEIEKKDLAWFVEAALSAHDEKDVSLALMDFKLAQPGLGFVPLGTAHDGEDAKGKSTIAKNQSANALIALKELVTNAYDAEIDFLGKKHGVETKTAPNLIQAWGGVKKAIEESGGFIPEDQLVISRCNDEKSGATSITVADRGSGQANADMVPTMLSLSSGKSKPGRNDCYGSHGQGSSGVHIHAGNQGYKLILTSTGKDETTGKTQWSVGLVRKRPAGTDGTFIVEWMSLDPKNLEVPSFEAPEINHLRRRDGSVWAGKEPSVKGASGVRSSIDRGTVVKVFSYKGAKRGVGKQWGNDLIDPFLSDLPHPICCLDMNVSSADSKRRKNTHGADLRYAKGAKDRLRSRAAKAQDERYAEDLAEDDEAEEQEPLAGHGKHDSVNGEPPASMPLEHKFSFQVDNPAFESFDQGLFMDGSAPAAPPQRVEVNVLAVFAPAKKGGKGDWKRKIKDFSNTRAFFSYFGQMHPTGIKTMDESALFTEILDAGALKDEVALFVDLDGVGKDFFNSLYMASRDRVAENEWYKEFSSAFREAVRSQLADDACTMKQWEVFCRERESARNKMGLLSQDGSGGWKAAESLAELSGLSRGMAKRLRMSADEPLPEKLTVSSSPMAVEASVGGVHALASGEAKAATTGTYVDKGASGMLEAKPSGKRKAEAGVAKPKDSDKPTATRAFGARHTVRASGRAVKTANGEAEAPRARLAGAELHNPDGSKTQIDPDLLDLGARSLDAHGHPCYDLGIAQRKGRKQAVAQSMLAARLEKDGACLVVTLALEGEQGRETMVHAKLAWEAKQKLVDAGASKRAKPQETIEKAPPILVQARFASVDGREVKGLATVAFSEVEFDPDQICSVVYDGVDVATGAHRLVATLNAQDGAVGYILESAKEGSFIPGVLNGISSAVTNLVRRRDYYMSLPSKPGTSDHENAKRARHKPGMSSENIMAYLEWPKVMASEGFSQWDALALDVAAKCIDEPGPASKKKPK